MVKRKQTEAQDNNTGEAVPPPVAEVPLAQPVDEIEGAAATPAATEQPKKEWTKRPDPFGILSVNWADGYKIAMLESDSNREIYIRFGEGSKDAMPKNFEAIKRMFKEEFKMYWDPKVQGWAKEIKPGVTPLIKQQNSAVRKAVEDAFVKAVKLEEQSARGPSTSDMSQFRNVRGV